MTKRGLKSRPSSPSYGGGSARYVFFHENKFVFFFIFLGSALFSMFRVLLCCLSSD